MECISQSNPQHLKDLTLISWCRKQEVLWRHVPRGQSHPSKGNPKKLTRGEPPKNWSYNILCFIVMADWYIIFLDYKDHTISLRKVNELITFILQ